MSARSPASARRACGEAGEAASWTLRRLSHRPAGSPPESSPRARGPPKWVVASKHAACRSRSSSRRPHRVIATWSSPRTLIVWPPLLRSAGSIRRIRPARSDRPASPSASLSSREALAPRNPRHERPAPALSRSATTASPSSPSTAPEKLNALTGSLLRRVVRRRSTTIAADPEVRVFLLRGAPRTGRPPLLLRRRRREGDRRRRRRRPKSRASTAHQQDRRPAPSRRSAVIDGDLHDRRRRDRARLRLPTRGTATPRSATITSRSSAPASAPGAPARAGRGSAASPNAKQHAAHGPGDRRRRGVPDRLRERVCSIRTRSRRKRSRWRQAIAGMNPDGVKLTLAHLDRIDDMSRDQALRWATALGGLARREGRGRGSSAEEGARPARLSRRAEHT